MPVIDRKATKRKALKERGTLNLRAYAVCDPAFQENVFLDAQDLVLVKNEMLRRVSLEGCSVTEAVVRFGVSDPPNHRAQTDFERDGLAGRVPDRRGPRRPHKLTVEVAEFLEGKMRREDGLGAKKLAARVEVQFGRKVHPRTIERGLARAKKL